MLLINGILEKIYTRKDRSVAVTFGLNELTVEQISELYKGLQNHVFLGLKNDVFKSQEKQILDGIEVDYSDNTKTPSQRLRAVLYVWWQQKPEGYKEFKDFYHFQMERLLEHFKGKLEDV